MNLVFSSADHEVWLSPIHRAADFRSPFNGEPFSLLLVSAVAEIDRAERSAICREIIRAGCRYAVCYGDECELWHDWIDETYLASCPDHIPSDEQFLMTTWHEDEPLEDVVFFVRNCTSFGNFVAQRFLVLIIGGDDTIATAVAEELRRGFKV